MRPALRRWVTVFLALAVAVVGPFVFAQVARAAGLPYTDSNSSGTIGLCDKSGNSVTSGNIHDHPFVFTAVSSAAGPPPYDGSGRKATLYAYQPRAGVVPGRWSGDQMTASSQYSNPLHPMASATLRDYSLADLLSEFPTRWDGLLQLRIYLSAPNSPVYSLPYPSTDIKVTGDTWTVVRGGTGSCKVGTTTSDEVAVFGTAAPKPTGSATPSSTPDASSVPGSSGTSPGPAVSTGPGGEALAGSNEVSGGSGSPSGALLTILGVVVVVGAGLGLRAWRRRASDV